MNTIHVQSVLHRGVRRIMLEFSYDPELVRIIKGIPDVRWSATKHCWHIPYSDESIKSLETLMKTKEFSIPEYITLCDERKYRFFDRGLSGLGDSKILEFKKCLEIQRYSNKTIVTYTEAIKTFMGYFKERDISELSKSDFIDFNVNYVLKNNFSASYQNQIISAIKNFYRCCYGKDIEFDKVERPFRGKSLPEIFSPKEVSDLLNSIRNKKHWCAMALIYACGLRRSELLNLRLRSIDSDRKMLKIRGGKGDKDRLVPIPESLIIKLREYYIESKPTVWLFEGKIKGTHYSETSLRETFVKAKNRAGIKKKLTLHSLRHSYATHLLENGVDLRFIQELLGHRSSKTTEIYTHVTTKSIEKIKSPFENLKIVKK